MTTFKTVLIIGASRGIGEAMVHQLAKIGNYKILALSRNVDRMKFSFGSLQNVHPYSFDLESPTLKSDLDNILNGHEKIDFMINNAGKLINKPFSELTHKELAACYQVNIIGVMECVQASLPYLSETTHIVNISSMGGFQGSVKFSGLSAYSTSKAALCSFTELFSEEYKDTNLSMNCLCLGSANTEMLNDAFPGYVAPLSATKMAEYIVDFTLSAHQWMKGKIIPLSLSTP